MKHKTLKTALLASSLAILLWGGITFTPPQDNPKTPIPITTENEMPDNSGISPLSDFSATDSDKDPIPVD